MAGLILLAFWKRISAARVAGPKNTVSFPGEPPCGEPDESTPDATVKPCAFRSFCSARTSSMRRPYSRSRAGIESDEPAEGAPEAFSGDASVFKTGEATVTGAVFRCEAKMLHAFGSCPPSILNTAIPRRPNSFASFAFSSIAPASLHDMMRVAKGSGMAEPRDCDAGYVICISPAEFLVGIRPSFAAKSSAYPGLNDHRREYLIVSFSFNIAATAAT